MKKFLPIDKSINLLDVGCGEGSILFSLFNLGYKNITGIDISHESINALKQTEFANQVTQTDVVDFLQKSIKEGKKWHFVLAIDILEHFTKDEIVKIISLLKQVIHPNGSLLIRVPNVQSPIMTGMVAFGDFTHETYFSPKSLAQVLKSSGLSNLEIHESGPIPYKVTGCIKFVFWNIIKMVYSLIYAIESGVLQKNSIVWSSTFWCLVNIK